MKSIPINWWIESDHNGKLQVIDGALVYRYYLVVQSGPGNPYDKEGKVGCMNLDIYKNESKVVILGEREKKLK